MSAALRIYEFIKNKLIQIGIEPENIHKLYQGDRIANYPNKGVGIILLGDGNITNSFSKTSGLHKDEDGKEYTFTEVNKMEQNIYVGIIADRPTLEHYRDEFYRSFTADRFITDDTGRIHFEFVKDVFFGLENKERLNLGGLTIQMKFYYNYFHAIETGKVNSVRVDKVQIL